MSLESTLQHIVNMFRAEENRIQQMNDLLPTLLN